MFIQADAGYIVGESLLLKRLDYQAVIKA